MHIQPLGNLSRTHTCGELTVADDGKDVVLLGWVHRLRDLGSLAFLDIRDRHGITQVVARDNPSLVEAVQELRPEYVVAIIGRVERRTPESVNPRLQTGEIEIELRDVRLLNEAKTPPFPIADEGPVSEDTRLKYRYLDLRRSRMQNNMILRHRSTMEIRKYFDANGFLEIETPML
ncbi:MAG: amino acid--tRNA ligase-related protein, partial [Vicinamibacterales bacterium]